MDPRSLTMGREKGDNNELYLPGYVWIICAALLVYTNPTYLFIGTLKQWNIPTRTRSCTDLVFNSRNFCEMHQNLYKLYCSISIRTADKQDLAHKVVSPFTCRLWTLTVHQPKHWVWLGTCHILLSCRENVDKMLIFKQLRNTSCRHASAKCWTASKLVLAMGSSATSVARCCSSPVLA